MTDGLRTALYRILDFYGYTTESTDAVIIAKKGKARIAIGLTDPTEKITTDFIARYLTTVGSLNCKKVVVTLQPVEKNIAKQLESNKITVWDRKSIEIEIGKIVVEDLIGSAAAEKIVLEKSSSEGAVKAEIEVAVEKEEGTVLKIPKSGVAEQIVKPIMTLEDVRELASHRLRGFQYDLKLVPFYLYEYRCVLIVEGRLEEESKSGLIGVNAITGECKEWKLSLHELVAELPHALKLEPLVDEEKAASSAHEVVITLNTTEIESVKDKGTAVIFEKKKVSPKDGTVDLIRKGLVYLPIWCVQGARGVMIINASTGKIIEEEIYDDTSGWTDG